MIIYGVFKRHKFGLRLQDLFLKREHAASFINLQCNSKGVRCRWSEIKGGEWEILPVRVNTRDITKSIQML